MSSSPKTTAAPSTASKSQRIKQGQEELLPLKDRIFGRTVCDDIYLPGDSTKLLAKSGDVLN